MAFATTCEKKREAGGRAYSKYGAECVISPVVFCSLWCLSRVDIVAPSVLHGDGHGATRQLGGLDGMFVVALHQ